MKKIFLILVIIAGGSWYGYNYYLNSRPIHFEGNGKQGTRNFIIRREGIYVAKLKHQTGNKNTYLNYSLYKDDNKSGGYDEADPNVTSLASAGYEAAQLYSMSYAIKLSSGKYNFYVDAAGAWTIDIVLPSKQDSFETVSGTGNQATDLYQFAQGQQVITIQHSGDENISVAVYNAKGDYIQELFSGKGNIETDKVFHPLFDGSYLFQVMSVGNWQITKKSK